MFVKNILLYSVTKVVYSYTSWMIDVRIMHDVYSNFNWILWNFERLSLMENVHT